MSVLFVLVASVSLTLLIAALWAGFELKHYRFAARLSTWAGVGFALAAAISLASERCQ